MGVVGRREFVFSTAAGAALFSPLLRLRRALGQGVPPPQRFIGLVITGGVPQKHFWPSTPGTNFTLPMCLKPLDSYKKRMLLVKGIGTVPNKGHWEGVACSLTGSAVKNYGTADNKDYRAQGESIDAVIRRSQGDTGKYLNVSANSGKEEGLTTVSYSGSARVATAFRRPSDGLKHLFSGAIAPPPAPPATIDRAAERRVQEALYARIRADAQRLRKELVGRERLRLEEHIDGLMSLERRVVARLQDETVQPVPQQACQPPRVDDKGDFGPVLRDYIDLFVEGIRCNQARTFTMLFGFGASHYMDWVPGISRKAKETYHLSCQHEYTGKNDTVAKNYQLAIEWHAKEVAYLMQRLEGIPEGNGTALDNTLIYWTSDIAGNPKGVPGRDDHSHFDQPAIILGGSPSRMKMGQYINLGASQAINQNKVLTTIARGLGAKINGFGAHPTCGPLPGVLA